MVHFYITILPGVEDKCESSLENMHWQVGLQLLHQDTHRDTLTLSLLGGARVSDWLRVSLIGSVASSNMSPLEQTHMCIYTCRRTLSQRETHSDSSALHPKHSISSHIWPPASNQNRLTLSVAASNETNPDAMGGQRWWIEWIVAVCVCG